MLFETFFFTSTIVCVYKVRNREKEVFFLWKLASFF